MQNNAGLAMRHATGLRWDTRVREVFAPIVDAVAIHAIVLWHTHVVHAEYCGNVEWLEGDKVSN